MSGQQGGLTGRDRGKEGEGLIGVSIKKLVGVGIRYSLYC